VPFAANESTGNERARAVSAFDERDPSTARYERCRVCDCGEIVFPRDYNGTKKGRVFQTRESYEGSRTHRMFFIDRRVLARRNAVRLDLAESDVDRLPRSFGELSNRKEWRRSGDGVEYRFRPTGSNL